MISCRERQRFGRSHDISSCRTSPHKNTSNMPLLQTLPFWIHIAIESPASINFFVNPSDQLTSPAAQAHAIIRQYGVLLFISNLIALIFALRNVDKTSRRVAGALAVYHLAPLVRAGGRVVGGDALFGKGLGGPVVHLIVHGICFLGLAALGLPALMKRKPSGRNSR